MAGLTPAHLLIILVIALIVIGPGKLPEVGAAIGKSLREFQKASGGITDTLTGAVTPPAQAPQAPQAPVPMQPAPPAQSYYAAAPAYPAPAYPAPAYPAPAAPAAVPYPVMGAIEPTPAAPVQPVPDDYPQPNPTVQQPPSPPRVD